MKNEEEQTIKLPEEQGEETLGQLLRIAGVRPAVPEDASLRVKSAVHSAWRKSLESKTKRIRFFYLAAATAACTILYFFSLELISHPPEIPIAVGIVENLRGDVFAGKDEKAARQTQHVALHEVLNQGTVVQTGQSGRLLLRLPGGAAIRLDVNSRLRFQSQSSFQLDSGTVYIDSGLSGRHLALATQMGIVKDVGTQYEVRLTRGTMRIRVREGSILLHGQKISKSAAAGMQLSIDQRGITSLTHIQRYGEGWNWLSDVAPGFPIEGRSLAEFLNWITRENGWTLEYSDRRIHDRAPSTILHGSLYHLQPDQMLAAVLPVCGLNYSLNQGVLTIHQGK